MAISSMIADVAMICDGASNSCATKVSTSVSSARKAVMMALDESAVTGKQKGLWRTMGQSISNLCALKRVAQCRQRTGKLMRLWRVKVLRPGGSISSLSPVGEG